MTSSLQPVLDIPADKPVPYHYRRCVHCGRAKHTSMFVANSDICTLCESTRAYPVPSAAQLAPAAKSTPSSPLVQGQQIELLVIDEASGQVVLLKAVVIRETTNPEPARYINTRNEVLARGGLLARIGGRRG